MAATVPQAYRECIENMRISGVDWETRASTEDTADLPRHVRDEAGTVH